MRTHINVTYKSAAEGHESRLWTTNLLLVWQLSVLLGEDFSQVQVAHLRVQLGVLGPFLHEEAEVRCQGLLGEIWVFLGKDRQK